MNLSIVIPCLNDNVNLPGTINSIRETTPEDRVQIIVIDDESTQPVNVPHEGVEVYRMAKRVGGGVARHIGALHAKAEHMLFTDSHMRFRPGWYEKAMSRIVGRPNTVHVAKCLGLAADRMDLDKAQGAYYGAKMIYVGQDPNHKDRPSVMEGVWAGPKEDDAIIECMMGACYFWNREHFLSLGGKNLLRDWGSEEPFTSLKVWLTGGCIRVMTEVEIGHMFRENNGYSTPWASIVYNKLMMAEVCLPKEAARAIEQACRRQYEERFVDVAKDLLAQDSRLIQLEQHRLRAMSTLTFEQLLRAFHHEKFW